MKVPVIEIFSPYVIVQSNYMPDNSSLERIWTKLLLLLLHNQASIERSLCGGLLTDFNIFAYIGSSLMLKEPKS